LTRNDPSYRRDHLHRAQSVDKTVFESWTHALSYVPTRDYRLFLPEMKRGREATGGWFGQVRREDIHRVVSRIRRGGPLTIRDIDDDVLVEKEHLWASRKPSKRALQLAFYAGVLTISARSGMLQTYELTDRHFGWDKRPKPAPSEASAPRLHKKSPAPKRGKSSPNNQERQPTPRSEAWFRALIAARAGTCRTVVKNAIRLRTCVAAHIHRTSRRRACHGWIRREADSDTKRGIEDHDTAPQR